MLQDSENPKCAICTVFPKFSNLILCKTDGYTISFLKKINDFSQFKVFFVSILHITHMGWTIIRKVKV